MNSIIEAIENFVGHLPPLLQLILGAAIVMAFLKLLTVATDFFDKKRDEKKKGEKK